MPNTHILACTVCGTNSTLEAQFNDVKLYRCPNCDHCFTDIHALEKFATYDAEYYQKHHRNWNLHPLYPLFSFILNTIEKSFPSDNPLDILDVGCGQGHCLAYLKQTPRRISLTGIDLSDPPTTDKINFIQGDFLTTGFSETFNVVLSLATIEHALDIHEFVDRLMKVCRPGGLIFLMTLDDRGLLYELARKLNSIGLKAPFERLYGRHHLNHFNTTSLTRLLKSHTLKIVKIYHHNVPIQSADTGIDNPFLKAFSYIFLTAIFAVGKLFNRTYLQTIICRPMVSFPEHFR